MDFNNETPANGAETNSNGYSLDEAFDRIAGLLDSTDEDAATHEDDADAETLTDEEREPSHEDGTDEGEQTSEEDSTDPDATDEDVESEGEGEAEPAATVSDDAEIDFGNGERVRVGELKAGYLRQKDYDQRAQETAAERKTYETVRQQTIENLYTFRQHAWAALSLEANHSAEELQAMVAEDPGLYVQVKAKIDQRNAIIAETNRRIAQLETEKAQMDEDAHKAAQIESQRRLVEMRPELVSDETLAPRLGKFLLDMGIPKDLIANETNPILFDLAIDAMEMRALKASQKAAKTAKAKIDAKPPLVKAGSAGTKAPARSDLQKAKSRLSKSGSIDDAFAVLSLGKTL